MPTSSCSAEIRNKCLGPNMRKYGISHIAVKQTSAWAHHRHYVVGCVSNNKGAVWLNVCTTMSKMVHQARALLVATHS